MKIATPDEYLRFYREKGYIIFEEMFDKETLFSFSYMLSEVHSTSLCKERDLWRKDGRIEKNIRKYKLAETAARLAGVKPLRLAYDLYFSSLPDFSSSHATLEDISCVQGVVCGAFVPLPGVAETEASLPLKEGSVLFVKADRQLDLSLPLTSYYLVVFALCRAIFIMNRCDSGLKEMMVLGYNYGDRLRDDLNPIIYR